MFSNLTAQQGPERRNKFKEKFREELNLNEEQQSKIEQLKINHEKQMVDLKAELDKREISLKELKQKINFSRNDYISSIERINEIKNQITVLHANHRMDVYELLDENQKEVWIKMGDNMNRGKHFFGEHRMKRFNRF
jgi:hypothetical protein